MLCSECRESLTALSTGSFCKRKVQLRSHCDIPTELLLLDCLTRAGTYAAAWSSAANALLLNRDTCAALI